MTDWQLAVFGVLAVAILAGLFQIAKTLDRIVALLERQDR